jgi:polar amino acid transport system substrate-binding protein
MKNGATFAYVAAAISCATIAAGCSNAPAAADDNRSAIAPSTRVPATRPLPVPSASVVSQLAPGGKLRAAINFGNPVLANRDAAGRPAGVSVDLARELARRLGVPVELVTYDAAGKVVEGLKSGTWDIAFLAIDPARAVDIDYTAAYVVIEGAYLVRDGSPLTANQEVDRPGTRVVVGRGSAYDLFLSRELKQATIVRAPTSREVVDQFVAQSLDVAAGVKQQLESDARRIPGLRLLPGRFMAINQAIGMPKGRDAALPWLRDFVEEMKASGFVAQSLARHRIEGASLAPPAG